MTWTLRVAPAASVIGWPARVSVWLPWAPASVKAAGLPTAPSLTQVTPVPEPPGSGSVRVTPVAVPVPPLWTVTVKPIGLPALTLAASAVLVTVRAAGWQMIEAGAELPPSLPLATVAVLL